MLVVSAADAAKSIVALPASVIPVASEPLVVTAIDDGEASVIDVESSPVEVLSDSVPLLASSMLVVNADADVKPIVPLPAS